MDGLSSFLLCLLGHHRHVPGAGRQYVPAGVPGCGQGQGQRRDDDLLPQRRAPAQLAATADARQPGLQRHGRSLAPARGAALRFPTLTPEAASAFAGGRAGGLRPRPGVPASCEHQADQRCHPLLKAPPHAVGTSSFLTDGSCRARRGAAGGLGLGRADRPGAGPRSSASGGREAAPLWPGPGLLFYVSLYTSDRGSGSAGLCRSAGFWMGRGLHRGPLPQPTAGAPAGGRTNCEGEARGLGARSGGSEKKRKYLLNKTKHVSVPFFRLC